MHKTGGLVSCNQKKNILAIPHADRFSPRAGFFHWGIINRLKYPLKGYQYAILAIFPLAPIIYPILRMTPLKTPIKWLIYSRLKINELGGLLVRAG